MKYQQAYQLCWLMYVKGTLGYRLKQEVRFIPEVVRMLEKESYYAVLKKLRQCEHSGL